jgi:hypothetical protein
MAGLAGVSEAADRGEWQLALDLLDACGTEQASAAGLELRARALYGAGDFEGSVAAWEDLHALLVAENDPSGAALAAAMVAMFLMMDTGLMAAVRGWLRRAERLVPGPDEVPAHAVIAVVRGYERFMCGDMDAARKQSSQAIELGSRLGVAPAVVIGRVCAARVRIFDGQVDEGLALLDDIAVDLMSGAVDPLTTGMMYCELICAAQGMALQDRVIEWTDVMDRWRHGSAIGSIGGRCRVHRAEVLRMSGTCDEAESEALGACDELRPWMRREFGWPLVELGNIRLRKGDLAGADEAFVAAHEHAWSPHPGLALLRLAQGDVDSAATMIADAIAHPFDIPWKERPPFGDLRLAPLLDAQAEIAAAAHDVDTLRSAARRLAAIAASFPSRSLAAGAALAGARLHLLDGDAEAALHAAAEATAAWADIGAPFEAAMARIVLGEARLGVGDDAGARMEWRAAHSACVRFGAAGWAQHAERLASGDHPSARSERSGAASATFRCDGDTRTIESGGHTVLMRDLLGFRYIARLLAEPGREFHVLDLVAVERGSLPTGRNAGRDVGGSGERRTDGLHTDGGATGLPMIDEQARAAYRRRLADVEEDIEEAERMNDTGRVELAQRDREYLIAELSRATGLGFRPRTVGGSGERARTSVTRSLRYALDRLAEHHPALAVHLGQCVHTGTYCVYTTDPTAPLTWTL